MREGWEVKPLGEVSDILDSRRKPITKRDRKPGPYPYYGATGVLDHVDGYLFDEPLVLIGEDGAKWGAGENSAYAIDGKCWVNNHAHVLRPHRTVLDDQWLIYHLNASDLTAFVSGMTVPKLNQGRLREIPVPLPPIAEQERIVSILNGTFEGIDTAISNAEQNIANARGLYQSVLDTEFAGIRKGQDHAKLGDVSRINYGYTAKSSTAPVGPKFLRITDIQDGKVDWNTVPFCEISMRDHKKHQLASGDIVFARTGATTGKSYLVNEAPDAVCASYLIRLRVDSPSVLPSFLSLYFQTRSYWKCINSGISGSAQGGFNASKLAELRIPIPPLAEQSEFAERMRGMAVSARQLAYCSERKIALLQELKWSVLQEGFAGALMGAREAALNKDNVAAAQ